MPTDTAQSQKRAAANSPYLQQVTSLVPTEAIAVYLTIDQLILTAKAEIPYENVFWFVLVLMTLGTLLYLRRRHPTWNRVLLGTFSFVVWVAVAGHSFGEVMKDKSWYNPIYGSIFLPLYTFFLPMIAGPPAAETREKSGSAEANEEAGSGEKGAPK